MSLRDLRLEYEYRSDHSNLVDEFYVPCFNESTEYRRAVGFFTSHGLALAGEGLATFILRKGHMRLVASPLLEAEDIEALRRGYEARGNVVERALLRQLGEGFLEHLTSIHRIRLECLAWLIAEGRLDIKIAISRHNHPNNDQAIYHEKIGLFSDAEGNIVAFTGSPNETVGGLVSNFESIDVYKSWDDPHERVIRKRNSFERLWINDTSRLEVFDFPEAAKRKLLKFRTKQKPEYDPESKEYVTGVEVVDTPITWTTPEFKPPNDMDLYPHQVEAINAWNSTKSKHPQAKKAGFLEMATGSGKTIAALCIAAKLYEEIGRLAIVIVVPSTVLVEQWCDEAERFGLLPIKAHGENPAWRKESWRYARSFRRKHIDRPCIVVTNKSFATSSFQEIVSGFGDSLLLIADEAHNLGAEQAVNILPQNIEYRLALSATPRRYFDDEGTQLLLNYFGEAVYEFTLKDAIGVCLTPYDYFVTPVELSLDEVERYVAITSRINRLRAIRGEDKDGDSHIQRLYIERARIVSDAEGKIEALSRLLDEINLRELKHTFVYTSDKNPEQTHSVVSLLQEGKHLLVHQFTEQESGDKQLREALLKRFALGNDLQVLVAKRCLDEGVDIPPTRRAYFLASTTNPRQYIQRRGRLLRKYPDKTHAVIHDFLVIPPMNTKSNAEKNDVKAIVSEFNRVVEFAATARNGASTRASLLEIAKRLGVTHIIAGGGS